MIRGWLRERRVRRLRNRARTLPADEAASEADLATLATAVRDGDGDGERRALAVEALGALARGTVPGVDAADRSGGDPTSVPERAAVALADALPAVEDDELAARALRTLRFVVVERPDSAAADRLDAVCAAAVDDWDHAVHRQVTIDAGALLAAGADLSATRAALWTALDAGPPAVREDAALAYSLLAGDPDSVSNPDRVAAALGEVVRDPPDDDAFPPEGSAARTLADGLTVAEAAERFAAAAER